MRRGDRGDDDDRAAAARAELGSAARAQTNALVRFERSEAAHVSSSISVAGAAALAAGVRDEHVEAAEALDGGLDRPLRVRRRRPRRPAPPTRRARRRSPRAAPAAGPVTTTRAPSAAKSRAIAAPIPVPPPVTSATFPASCMR